MGTLRQPLQHHHRDEKGDNRLVNPGNGNVLVTQAMERLVQLHMTVAAPERTFVQRTKSSLMSVGSVETQNNLMEQVLVARMEK